MCQLVSVLRQYGTSYHTQAPVAACLCLMNLWLQTGRRCESCCSRIKKEGERDVAVETQECLRKSVQETTSNVIVGWTCVSVQSGPQTKGGGAGGYATAWSTRAAARSHERPARWSKRLNVSVDYCWHTGTRMQCNQSSCLDCKSFKQIKSHVLPKIKFALEFNYFNFFPV